MTLEIDNLLKNPVTNNEWFQLFNEYFRKHGLQLMKHEPQCQVILDIPLCIPNSLMSVQLAHNIHLCKLLVFELSDLVIISKESRYKYVIEALLILSLSFVRSKKWRRRCIGPRMLFLIQILWKIPKLDTKLKHCLCLIKLIYTIFMDSTNISQIDLLLHEATRNSKTNNNNNNNNNYSSNSKTNNNNNNNMTHLTILAVYAAHKWSQVPANRALYGLTAQYGNIIKNLNLWMAARDEDAMGIMWYKWDVTMTALSDDPALRRIYQVFGLMHPEPRKDKKSQKRPKKKSKKRTNKQKKQYGLVHILLEKQCCQCKSIHSRVWRIFIGAKKYFICGRKCAKLLFINTKKIN